MSFHKQRREECKSISRRENNHSLWSLWLLSILKQFCKAHKHRYVCKCSHKDISAVQPICAFPKRIHFAAWLCVFCEILSIHNSGLKSRIVQNLAFLRFAWEMFKAYCEQLYMNISDAASAFLQATAYRISQSLVCDRPWWNIKVWLLRVS